MPIKARIEFKICLLTYKAIKYGKPKYLRDYLIQYTEASNVSVRNANDPHRLFETRVNKETGGRMFSYAAPRLYNKLTVAIKSFQTDEQFKKKLKTYLFDKCCDSEQKIITEAYKC